MTYAGVEREYPAPCSPLQHKSRGFQPNGECHICGKTREQLINIAVTTIQILGAHDWEVKERDPMVDILCSQGHFGKMRMSTVGQPCPVGDGGRIKRATTTQLNEYTIEHGGRDPLG